MRILILHNKVKQNTYANFLLLLLLQALSELHYFVIKANNFSEAKRVNVAEQNTVILIDTHKVRLRLFSKFNLHFLVKKQRLTWLVQVTDNKIISSGIRQLIISNEVEKLISGKTLSSISLAVCSYFARQKIVNKYNLFSNNIHILPVAAGSLFQSLSWSEQQSVKMQYTQGREFFFVNAGGKTFSSFMLLLKSFSGFKKWQQSSMKLVISGSLSFTNTKEWNEKINTYKYRNDVVIINEQNEKEYATLLAAAYVFIHMPMLDNDIAPLLQAMQCETPCISFVTDSIKEYAGEAVILVEANDYEKLGEKFILLYKDETLRTILIKKGKLQAELYTKESAMEAIQNVLPSNLP